MNPAFEIIFAISWIILLVYAVRYYFMMVSIWNNDKMTGGYTVRKRRVTKTPHPEMAEVKSGDELLVVNFGEEEIRDPLLQSLEDRISELEDEDQDEGDGDIVVRI
tara:strand:+ start:1442 stop:1759 length:318 start_codon:yes stop_codon:yes gene_type:complete